MKTKTKLLNIALTMILVFASINIVSADTNPRPLTNFCSDSSRYSISNPPRISRDQCPDGIGFPSFNVYQNYPMVSELVDVNGTTETRYLYGNENDFARVRKVALESDGQYYIQNHNDGNLGFTNNLRLQEGERGEILLYVHNAGAPDRNTGVRNSVVAKNTKIKVNGFRLNTNGDYVSNPGTTHTFTAQITSSNSVPQLITDQFTITTEPNKMVRLRPISVLEFSCRNKDCDGAPVITDRDPQELVGSNGLNLTSSFEGSGVSTGDFYGSNHYRKKMLFEVEVFENPVCESLTYKLADNPSYEGEPVEVAIKAIPSSFQSSVNATISGRGRVNLNGAKDRLEITDWQSDDLVTMFVSTEPSVPACTKTLVMPSFTCENLEFAQVNTPTVEGEKVFFRLIDVTEGFRRDISYAESDGDINRGGLLNRRISMENWQNGDEFVAKVPGYPQCEYRATLEVEEEPVCNYLGMRPNFDEEEIEFVGQELEFTVGTLPLQFIADVEYTLDGSSENIRETGFPLILNDVIKVQGWSEGSTLNAVVPGYEDICEVNYIFPRVDTEQPVCRALDFDVENITRDGDTAVIPVDISVEEGYGDYEVITNSNDPSVGTSFDPVNSTVTVTGISDQQTTVSAFVQNERNQNEPNCADTYTFPGKNICEMVELNVINETDDKITFEATVEPSSFNLYAAISSGSEIINLEEEEGKITFDVINFNSNTSLKVGALGTSVDDCYKTYKFPETTEDILCRDLDVTPDSYDHTESTVQRFKAGTTPANLDVPYIWEVYQEDEDGDRELISREEDNETYTVRDLDGRQIIRVYIEDEFVEKGYECEAEIEGEVPYNLCPDLEIRRTSRQPGLYCPSNGQPIILEATGYGDFEDDLVWRAEGDCNPLTGPIFTDGEQEARCELVTDISNPVIVRGCDPSSVISVESVTQPDECRAIVSAKDLPGDETGEIFKEVAASSFVSRDINEVTYRINYKPNLFFSNIFDKVTIFDNIGGTILGSNPEFIDLRIPPGTLSPIPESMTVTYPKGRNIVQSGNLFSPEGLELNNLNQLAQNGESVTIQYRARLNSALKLTDACERLVNSCGETFINTAFTNFGQESSASLTALCPFILARGFGDVFLERDFASGIDIAKCTSRPSAEGPVFTPAPPELNEIVRTGANIAGPNHRICQEGGVEGYGDEVLNSISSSVCEVSLGLSEKWQKESITNGIEVNILRIARNLIPFASETISSLTEANLANLNPNPGSQVIIRDNADLTIGNPGETLIVDGQAKTIIVRNGNLRINSNIDYGAAIDPTKPPVIAFLVINGNIEIDPEVTSLVGIYAAVEKDEGTGFIQRATGKSDKLITIHGSVFGDLEPLFNQTTAVGDLVRDRGAVTVIYDGRIILNTPPGLEDIVEFNQYQTANGNNIFN